jgi:PAS domain S-box-containing protein
MSKEKKSSGQAKKKTSGKGKAGAMEKEKSKEIFESILNAISDGILVIDKDFKINLVNRALAHEYGYGEPEELIGRKCYDIFRDRKRKCTDCVASKVFQKGKTQHAFGSRKDAHGNELNMEIYAYPLFDDKGKVEKVVEYTRNVTKEKMLEKEVQETEKKLSRIFSVSRDMTAQRLIQI